MKTTSLLLSLLFFTFGLSAHAECPQIQGHTIVFGGLGSKTSDMQICYPDFLAISHADGPQYVSCLAAQINADPNQKYVVAGHSSGSAEAESLVQKVKDKSRIHLVLLEGAAYNRQQRGNVNTTCWYAQNSDRNIRGFNAPYMLDPKICPQPAKAFEAGWCENSLCLHVAIVNLNVPSQISRRTVFSEGLANCQGNLEWAQEH